MSHGPPTTPPPSTPPPASPPPAAAPLPPPARDPRAGFPRVRERVTLDAVRSPYGLIVATAVVLIFALPNLLTGIALLVLDGFTLDNGAGALAPTPGPLIATLILQLGVIAIALLPLLASGRPYARLMGPTRWTLPMWGLGLVIGIGTAIVTYTINAIVVLIAGVDEPVEQGLTQVVTAGGLVTVLAVTLAVVVAPIGEEIIFRGVLHRAVAEKAGFLVGAIISSALFALVHLEVILSQPFGLVGLFVVGFLLAWAYHLTGSLIVPILGHAVYNAISVGLVFLVESLDLDLDLAWSLAALLLTR